MQVRIKGYLTFRSLLGDITIEFEDGQKPTLEDLLDVLFTKCGEQLRDAVLDRRTGELQPQVAVLVNGVHYTHTPDRLKTQLKHGDTISIFPPIAGGS